MSVDPAAASRSDTAEVALIVALGIERACFDPHVTAKSGIVAVHQCGPGPARAAAAAALAAQRGVRALVSCGLAGALTPHVSPGTVLLPDRIIADDGRRFGTDTAWRQRLAAALGGRYAVEEGALLASSAVVGLPELKRRAAQESGAVAVDMESAAVAEAAAAAGLPFVVLRVVADGADDRLPAGVEGWVDEAGGRRLAPVVDAALRPAHWPVLWTLARRYRTARRTLIGVAGELTPQGFLFRA